MICLGVSTRLVLSTGTRMTTYRVRQENVGQARAKRSLAPEGQGTNGPRINSHQSSKDAGLGRDAGCRTSCLVCLSNAHACNVMARPRCDRAGAEGGGCAPQRYGLARSARHLLGCETEPPPPASDRTAAGRPTSHAG